MAIGKILIKQPTGDGTIRIDAIDPKTDAACKPGSVIPFKTSPDDVKPGSDVYCRVISEGVPPRVYLSAVEIKNAGMDK